MVRWLAWLTGCSCRVCVVCGTLRDGRMGALAEVGRSPAKFGSVHWSKNTRDSCPLLGQPGQEAETLSLPFPWTHRRPDTHTPTVATRHAERPVVTEVVHQRRLQAQRARPLPCLRGSRHTQPEPCRAQGLYRLGTMASSGGVAEVEFTFTAAVRPTARRAVARRRARALPPCACIDARTAVVTIPLLWHLTSHVCLLLVGCVPRSFSAPPPAPPQDLDVNAGGPSALAGLSVQQMLDLDVDVLAVKIDRHHASTKKALLVRRGVGGSGSPMLPVTLAGKPAGKARGLCRGTRAGCTACHAMGVDAPQPSSTHHTCSCPSPTHPPPTRWLCFARGRGALPLQDHFMEFKSRMMAAQAQAVDEERQTGAGRLAVKQARVADRVLLLEPAWTTGHGW